MAAGPKSKTPTSADLGLKGAEGRAWTALKRQYGAWWVRASNGEAYARLGDNPYGGKFYEVGWTHISNSVKNKVRGVLL